MSDYFTADLQPTSLFEEELDEYSNSIEDFEEQPECCPLCAGTGYLEELMGGDCPDCAGTGYLDDFIV
jgi:DnaJ-class molecular chaperone